MSDISTKYFGNGKKFISPNTRYIIETKEHYNLTVRDGSTTLPPNTKFGVLGWIDLNMGSFATIEYKGVRMDINLKVVDLIGGIG